MNVFGGFWKIFILLCVSFLITSGCVMQPPVKNVSSSLPPIFTAPVGGFVDPNNNTIRDANGTFESDYLFYSGTFAGEVKFLVSSQREDQIWNDRSVLYVEPSSIMAEPNHTYFAKVYLNTSSIPKDFFIPQPSWVGPYGGSGLYSRYVLKFNVSLDGKSSQYCNDTMRFASFDYKPSAASDVIEVEKGSLSLKKGETKFFNITYLPMWYTGMQEISYSSSQTPLDVTITPARFYARHSFYLTSEGPDFIYPLVVKITAPSYIKSGQYLVSFTQHGGGKVIFDTWINCTDCKKIDKPQNTFVVNVTVE
jgi:hypothetical protein